jgi:MFS family permease
MERQDSAMTEELINRSIIENSNAYFNLQDCLRLIYGKGIYQTRNLFMLSTLWGFVPIIVVLLPFFVLEPEFLCRNKNDPMNTFLPCTVETVCDEDNYERIISPLNEVVTWVNDFDLICTNRYLIYIISSSYFVGMILSNLLTPRLCESYGRKPVLQFYMVVYILNNIFIMFVTYNKFLLIYSFVSGCIYTGVSIPTFVLNFEFQIKSTKNLYSSILNCSFALGALTQIGFFYFFKSWRLSLSVGLMLFILILFFSYTIMESPSYLVQHNKTAELFSCLEYVAKINGTEKRLKKYTERIEYIEIPKGQLSEHKFCMVDILKDSETRVTMLLVGSSWFNYAIIAYGTLFNIRHYGNNIFINGLSAYLANVVSIMISNILLNRFGYNKSMMIYYFLCFLSNISISIVHDTHLRYVFLFVNSFCTGAIGSINYIYTADLFNNEYRVSAVSCGSLINRLAGAISPFVVGYFVQPTWAFAVLCLFAIACLFILQLRENKKIM